MKLLLTALLLLSFSAFTTGQTVFTYGNYSVSKAEFLKAFEKNNTNSPGTDRSADIRNYLDLYERFKLKVRDAYDMKLDTLLTQQAEVQNFRHQIEEPYLTDQKERDRLVREAFERSGRDIRLSHIFIPFHTEFISNPGAKFSVSAADSQQARKKIYEAWDLIKKGQDFSDVAIRYSLDPAVSANRGDIGYLTVFGLPYPLETIAWSLPLNGVSEPFASEAGYHIFKKTGEREALGKMKVEQILIASDPAEGPAGKARAQKLSDSLYKAVLKGSSFEQLARQYSYDRLSSEAGGALPPVGVGQYDPVFENAVFGLKKDGDISAPVETSSGFHILKRLQYQPVNHDFKATEDMWRAAVDQDKRSANARKTFEKQAIAASGLRMSNFDQQELFRYTDSFLQKGVKPVSASISDKTVLLEFPGEKVTADHWLKYVSAMNPDRSIAEYRKLWDSFTASKAVDYYRRHLEQYNPEFAAQLNEFLEGNLLFEVMERKVWNVAAADTAGMRKYYQQHKDKYVWQKSADAVIINASDSAAAAQARKKLVEKTSTWKKIAAASGGTIVADSGRVEWTQIPVDSAKIKAGLLTPVVVNEDRSATFTYVIRIYTNPSPRNYNDARGMVMNDYQAEIEEKWIAGLKKKYPVKVNEEVVNEIISHK